MRVLKDLWRDYAVLFQREIWTIGLVPTSIEAVLNGNALPSPHWLEAPRRWWFHADPFPFIANGRPFLLFEMWSMIAGRGWIAAAPLDVSSKGTLRDAPTAIDLNCHMSYPFTFVYDGAVYCAPETWEAGGVRIFRMGSNPCEWKCVTHILEGLPIVDPTLFEHDGRWWLMATLRGQSPETNLHAWHAPTPFGSWTAHQLSPLKSDISSARPAGAVFQVAGALYRPAQDCSVEYGSAISINRILRLDPEGFEEVEVRRLGPSQGGPYPHGLHTLNGHNGWLIIDGKRRVLDPFNPLWILIPHARRWLTGTLKKSGFGQVGLPGS